MDINNFGPFNTDVWGNVSDWIMTTVTTITAIYIYKTFNSQIQVQKDQQKTTTIESERFRIENKPELDINFRRIVNKPSPTETESYLNFYLTIIKNDCKNLTIKTTSSKTSIKDFSVSESQKKIIIPIDYLYKDVNYDLHFQTSTNRYYFISLGGSLIFDIIFEDIIGNVYSQNFTYIFRDQIIEDYSKTSSVRILQTNKG